MNAFGRTENGRYDLPSWKHKWIMMKITIAVIVGKFALTQNCKMFMNKR